MVKKNLKIRLLVLTEFTNVVDRQTDRRTDGHIHSIARQKNAISYDSMITPLPLQLTAQYNGLLAQIPVAKCGRRVRPTRYAPAGR